MQEKSIKPPKSIGFTNIIGKNFFKRSLKPVNCSNKNSSRKKIVLALDNLENNK